MDECLSTLPYESGIVYTWRVRAQHFLGMDQLTHLPLVSNAGEDP